MNAKHLPPGHFFSLIDKDQDGFINLDEWSEGIDTIMTLTPFVKEKFFNYMD